MLIRMDRKVLTGAIAALLVLVASGSASALTISSLGGLDYSSYQLRIGDLNLIGWSYETTDTSRYTSYFSGSWYSNRTGATRVAPVPEPSAAIGFSLGLFSASRLARRKR